MQEPRGPVRRIVRTRSDNDRVEIVEYDREGRRVRHESHHPVHPNSSVQTFYDASGRLLGYEYASADPETPPATTRYVYDDGYLVRIEHENFTGPTRKPTEVSRRPGGGRIENVSIEIPEGDLLPATSRLVEYDEDDNKLVETLLDDDGQMLQTTRYIYDDAGHLLEERHTTDVANDLVERLLRKIPGAGMLPEVVYQQLVGLFVGSVEATVAYTYDASGRRIKSSRSAPMSDGEATVQRWEYNDHDDVVRMVMIHPNRGFSIGLGGITENESPPTITIYTFEYEYDHHGNWTRWATTARAPDEEPWHESVVTRVIEYYE